MSEFRNVPVYRGGVKVYYIRDTWQSSYLIIYSVLSEAFPTGVYIRLGRHRVRCRGVRPCPHLPEAVWGGGSPHHHRGGQGAHGGPQEGETVRLFYLECFASGVLPLLGFARSLRELTRQGAEPNTNNIHHYPLETEVGNNWVPFRFIPAPRLTLDSFW